MIRPNEQRGSCDLRVHVHIMRRKVESDQELEEKGPTGVSDSQESLQAGSSASIHQLADYTIRAIADLSVTMSRTAPNLEVWFNALAA